MAAGERSALGLGQGASRYVPIIRTAVVQFAILKLVPVSRIISFPSHRFCYRPCLPESLRLAWILGGAEELLPPRGWQARFLQSGLLRLLLDPPSCFFSSLLFSSLLTLRPSLVGVTLVFGCVLVGVKSQSLVRFWIASASGVLLFAHCTITIIDTQSSYRQKIFTRLAHGQSI